MNLHEYLINLLFELEIGHKKVLHFDKLSDWAQEKICKELNKFKLFENCQLHISNPHEIEEEYHQRFIITHEHVDTKIYGKPLEQTVYLTCCYNRFSNNHSTTLYYLAK